MSHKNWVLNIVYENTLVKEEVVDHTKDRVFKSIDSYFGNSQKKDNLIKVNIGKKNIEKYTKI